MMEIWPYLSRNKIKPKKPITMEQIMTTVISSDLLKPNLGISKNWTDDWQPNQILIADYYWLQMT